MIRTTCIACTSPYEGWVIDGDHTKPVCATHLRLYSAKGYRIKPGRDY